MKKFLLILFVYVAVTSGACAQKSYTVTVTITRIETLNAPLVIGLYSDEDSFKSKKAIDSLHVIPAKETITVAFRKVPAGTYAIALFQDVNKTGKLTTKEFGIPTEPVGISNYPLSGIPQPPKFKKAAFEVSENMAMTIPLMFSKDYKKEIKRIE